MLLALKFPNIFELASVALIAARLENPSKKQLKYRNTTLPHLTPNRIIAHEMNMRPADPLGRARSILNQKNRHAGFNYWPSFLGSSFLTGFSKVLSGTSTFTSTDSILKTISPIWVVMLAECAIIKPLDSFL